MIELPDTGLEPPSDREVHWFALWTRSRHEQVVREQLEQKGLEAFLPNVTRWSRWKDRKKKIDWPLFPGYCFARFHPRERLPVLNCMGVVNIISFEGEPAPIPEHEIDGIRQLVESDLAYDPCADRRGPPPRPPLIDAPSDGPRPPPTTGSSGTSSAACATASSRSTATAASR